MHESMSVPESLTSRRSGTMTRQPGLGKYPDNETRSLTATGPTGQFATLYDGECLTVAALLFPFCVLRSLVLRAHPLRRLADDFPRARDAELFLDIGAVSFNGFFTQMQLARNLVHVVSLAD
jgi:hypothetical protein